MFFSHTIQINSLLFVNKYPNMEGLWICLFSIYGVLFSPGLVIAGVIIMLWNLWNQEKVLGSYINGLNVQNCFLCESKVIYICLK